MVDYKLDTTGEAWWCLTHHRKAEFIRSGVPNVPDRRCCDPRLGGVMMPCQAVPQDTVQPELAPVAPSREIEDLDTGAPPFLDTPEFNRMGMNGNGLLPGPKPDDMSPMQRAIIDSDARQDPDNPFAYQTNQGTVFIASPQDMHRSTLMDGLAHRRFSRFRRISNLEVDRVMGEEGEDPSKWRR